MIFRSTLIGAAALGVTLVMAAPAAATNNQSGNTDHKIGVCHATGSAKNPYVFITVDKHAAQAHAQHQDGRDKIGAKSLADCPKVAGASTTPTPTPAPGKGGSTLSTSTEQPAALPKVGAESAIALTGAAALALAAGAVAARRFNA